MASVLAVLAALLLLGTPRVALADAERVKFLAEKLKDDDARVRTSAALALGASNEDLAVPPLCGALGDQADVVRQASAVALKRLSRTSSLGCLRDRMPLEASDTVKAAITRAIDWVTANGSGEAPTPPPADDKIKENPAAKYYISLSSVANSTSRAQPEVETVVLKAVKAKLDAAGTVQLAPPKETADRARESMKKRKMSGFYLAIAVDRFEYAGGSLKVKVKIGVFSYPGKSLIGNVDKTLTKEGVSGVDKSAEDQLLDMAAGLAIEQFAQNASAFL
jgi:hypothetical protein